MCNYFNLPRITSSLQLTARCLKSTLPQLRKRQSENFTKGETKVPSNICTVCIFELWQQQKASNIEIPRYKLDFELFGYSPDEYIRMGKPGPEDIVEEPLAKEEESKAESPNEEVAAAENESEVDGGVAAVELGEEMKELEMKEDESIGKST